MDHNSPLARWLSKLPQWSAVFEEDLMKVDFDVLLIGESVFGNQPSWLYHSRRLADLPNFDCKISDEHGIQFTDIAYRARMSPIICWIVENDFNWRWDGFKRGRVQTVYFRTASEKMRCLLTIPSALTSFY